LLAISYTKDKQGFREKDKQGFREKYLKLKLKYKAATIIFKDSSKVETKCKYWVQGALRIILWKFVLIAVQTVTKRYRATKRYSVLLENPLTP